MTWFLLSYVDSSVHKFKARGLWIPKPCGPKCKVGHNVKIINGNAIVFCMKKHCDMMIPFCTDQYPQNFDKILVRK
jgi:hypothetical protein